MRKIPRTAKLDEAVGRVQFGSPRNFSDSDLSDSDFSDSDPGLLTHDYFVTLKALNVPSYLVT